MKLSFLVCVASLVWLAGCGGDDKSASSGGGHEGHTHAEPDSMEAILARAQKLGIPTDFEALAQARSQAPDEAGPIYASLEGLTANANMDMLERYLRGQATDEEADNAIAGLAEEFKVMDQAVSKSTFAPKRDLAIGMQIEYIKEFDPMQKVSVAYASRALRNTRKGALAAAIEDFRKSAQVAKHAASEDLAMSEYLTTVCLDHWARAATSAAEASEQIRPDLARLIASLPKVDAKAGVGTDFALIRATIDRIRNGTVTYSEVAGYDTPAMVEGKPMDDILLANIDLAERYALNFVVNAYESWGDRAKIMELLHEAEHASQEESSEDTVIHAFEALAMTFTAPLMNGEALTQAQIETLLIAIAAADIKKRTGSAPTLSEAAAAAGVGEIDPFSGNPYVLKDSAEGITVYSVGLDLADDGGKPYTPGEMRGTDISVTL